MTRERHFALTELVAVQPGEPYRLLPFGNLVKNGKKRVITPELARQFKLPHFKPPIKRGSHKDEAPAGGHIIGLEVRSDGLYAIPELNERGAQSVRDGEYRYHSPEIIWEDGYLENPETGEEIQGPLIVGDALLHTPHLGEAAALYTIEPLGANKGADMSDLVQETVPVSFVEKLLERFDKMLKPANPEPAQEPAAPTPAPAVVMTAKPQHDPQIDQYKAQVEELKAKAAKADEYAAELQRMKAETERNGRVAHFATELKGTSLAGDTDLPAVLADLPEAAAAVLVTKFKALAEQARVSNLTADLGKADNPTIGNRGAEINDLVTAKMAEAKVDYNVALDMVRRERPDVFAAYERNVYKGGK